MLGVMLNGAVQAVVIYDCSRSPPPQRAASCARCWRTQLGATPSRRRRRSTGPALAARIKRIRPELDIYLLSRPRRREDRGRPPRVGISAASSTRSRSRSRSTSAILEGVADRFETPYFDNLKQYAQRPIGTFHALPIARGKSIFKSNWIRDMGEFYGTKLFLAESSATTGGLDSLLEPTATSRRRRTRRRARSAPTACSSSPTAPRPRTRWSSRRCCAPGDIVLVDRNCHKSHHYGMVLAGAQPLYVEAFPMTAYSMYGARAAAGDQEGAARPEGRGQARPRAHARPDQLHLRRAHLQHAARDGGVPRDQAGPDLPLGRGVVRLRALLAVPTGRGPRWARPADCEEQFADPAYRERLPGAGRSSSARTSIRRTNAARHAPAARSRTRCGCASTRPTRPTSRCPPCARARWCW